MKFYREKAKELLKENNISMYRLARRMGISNSTVSSWFRGMRFPRERNIVLMARALDVSVTEISDMKEVHDIPAEVSGYFQGWGSSLNKNKLEMDDPCIRAIKEIENIKSEQYRLRTVARAFMSTMQSMLYIKNFHGKYIVANESYLKAVGLDVSVNIIGKTDKNFMSQKVALINDTQDISIINTGKPLINKSLKFPFPNSKIKWCVMTKVPLRDNNQNIVGMVASFTDTTEEYHLRRQDEILNKEKEKLLTGCRLLGSFIDETKFALFVGEYKDTTLDLAEYIYRNKKSYEYIGDNEKWEDILAPEQREELLKIAENKKYPRKMIYNIVRKDGTIGTIEEKIRIQEDSGKKYFFSFIADIEKQDKIEVLYPKT